MLFSLYLKYTVNYSNWGKMAFASYFLPKNKSYPKVDKKTKFVFENRKFKPVYEQ